MEIVLSRQNKQKNKRAKFEQRWKNRNNSFLICCIVFLFLFAVSQIRSRASKSPTRSKSIAAPSAQQRALDNESILERSARLTRLELDKLWRYYTVNPDKLRSTKWYQESSESARQEYHNDLKRLGLTASQIKSLQRTEHDQSYYVDIAVGIALVIIGGIIMAIWP